MSTTKDPRSGVLKQDALYEPLADAAKGETSNTPASRNAPLSVTSLLPVPPGAAIPSDDTLHSRLRNRTLLLDKEAGVHAGTSAPKSKRPRPRWLTEGKGTGSRPIVSHKSTKRARSVKIVIPKEERKYTIYEPLAKLWSDYATKAVGDGNMATAGDRLLRMDLHGAQVEVVRSLDPGLVGISGILIIETSNTVLVISKSNKLYNVPKNTSIVRFRVGESAYELALPLLPYRASERSARKVKKRHFSFL